MAAKKQQTYRVGGFIKSWVEIVVGADSLEAAVEVSRTLKASDFVTYEGEVNDHGLEIVSVQIDNIPSVD